MRVLHVLYQSLPQISGSSIRSRDILMSQKEIGLEVLAITSPFQNADSDDGMDIINGIRYIRTSKNKSNSISDKRTNFIKRLLRFFSIFPFSVKLYKTVKKEKPDVIHAHAMFFCGIPSLFVGKLLKKPVVYEFRSLWMFQKAVKKTNIISRFIENTLFKIEAFTLKKAKHAVLLNENLKTFLESKKSLPTHFKVINNAVNTSLINELKKKTQNKSRPLVFGYIGTLTAYEGIEFLVEVFQELYDEGITNELVLYGKGISTSSVIAQIEKRKEIDSIVYRGTVAPSEVNIAFSEIDVIINPRLSTELTNSVTPLKPLEAMAYEKIFVGSDVGGITELVTDNENGFIFKAEDKLDLKTTIKEIVQLSEDERSKLLKKSLNFVMAHKSWIANAKKYQKIYTSLG